MLGHYAARFAWMTIAMLAACGQQRPAPASATANAAATSSVAAPVPPSAAGPKRILRDARCETTSCDYRKETCCEAEGDRLMSGCESKVTAAAADARGHKCSGVFAADWIGIDCLSTTTCQQGFTCCAYEGHTQCATKCDVHEACTPGLAETCHAGSRCQASSSSRSGGVCVVASPGTLCGPARCSGDQPGCVYDRKKQRGECVALSGDGGWPESVMGSLSAETALLQCASPTDCAGERCCTAGPLPMTECSGSCMSGIDVCDTVADCPVFLGPPTGCDRDAEHLPFLKTCRYRTN